MSLKLSEKRGSTAQLARTGGGVDPATFGSDIRLRMLAAIVRLAAGPPLRRSMTTAAADRRIGAVGLLHRSPDDVPDDAASDPYAAALQKFSTLSLPDRAAEVLAGISPALEADTNFQDKTQRKLLDVWIPEPPGRWPESLMPLWALLAEAFAALEQARLLVGADAGRDSGGALTFYWLTEEGRAALAAGDVADVVSRRLAD